jgi:hypothetical protein
VFLNYAWGECYAIERHPSVLGSSILFVWRMQLWKFVGRNDTNATTRQDHKYCDITALQKPFRFSYVVCGNTKPGIGSTKSTLTVMFVCDGWAKIVLFPYRTEYAKASTFFGALATLRRATICCVMSFCLSIHPLGRTWNYSRRRFLHSFGWLTFLP